MSITYHTNILMELHCDSKNKCRFREPLNDKDWGGGSWGGFEGKTKDECIDQAKRRGWLINGTKAICPDCVPMGFTVPLMIKPLDDQDPIDLEIFL